MLPGSGPPGFSQPVNHNARLHGMTEDPLMANLFGGHCIHCQTCSLVFTFSPMFTITHCASSVTQSLIYIFLNSAICLALFCMNIGNCWILAVHASWLISAFMNLTLFGDTPTLVAVQLKTFVDHQTSFQTYATWVQNFRHQRKNVKS